jgi:type I restriction enzyme S subunit
MASKNWQLEPLDEHVDLLTGFPFSSSHYTNDYSCPRLLRGDNVIQKSLRWEDAKRWPTNRLDGLSVYLLKPGDVVLAMDRPWIEAGLKTARITEDDLPSLLVQRVARLRAKPSLNQRFLYYVITSPAFTEHVLLFCTGRIWKNARFELA